MMSRVGTIIMLKRHKQHTWCCLFNFRFIHPFVSYYDWEAPTYIVIRMPTMDVTVSGSMIRYSNSHIDIAYRIGDIQIIGYTTNLILQTGNTGCLVSGVYKGKYVFISENICPYELLNKAIISV